MPSKLEETFFQGLRRNHIHPLVAIALGRPCRCMHLAWSHEPKGCCHPGCNCMEYHALLPLGFIQESAGGLWHCPACGQIVYSLADGPKHEEQCWKSRNILHTEENGASV